MDENEKQQVLEEWHNIKRVVRVTTRALWSVGRWVIGTLLLWDLISGLWKK